MEASGKPSLQDLIGIIDELHQDAVRQERKLSQLLAQVRLYEQASQDNLPKTWLPPVDSLPDLSDTSASRVRLAKQISIVGSNEQRDPVVRLKSTWFGRIYVNRLKRYKPVFWLVNWTWGHTYLPLVRFVSIHLNDRRTKKWLPLTKQRAFAKAHGIELHKLVESAVVETPAPKVFPAADKSYLQSPHDSYHFPAISVIQIPQGMIYGGTNLILTKDEVICHDLYDFERDSTSEELHGRTLIDPGNNRIRWLLHDDAPEHMPAAAAFVDACAANYAHWLTEVLPRIAAFCADEQFKHIPIVVNDGLHENIMESLGVVVGGEREIVALPIGRAIQADVLYLTSVAGYVPFERRNSTLLNHSHGLFSPNGLHLARNNVTSLAAKTSAETWPAKIYLRRNSGARRVTNAAKVEALFVAEGYAIVEPEKLTFMQQVAVFSKAKTIVASSGAAVANIIFAPKDAMIIVMIGRFDGTSYWYWQNIACASEKRVAYIFGNAIGDTGGIHSNILINLDVINNLLLEIS